MTYQVPVVPAVPLPTPRPDSEVFGVWTAEVVTPDGQTSVPALCDWELRAWPVARLGDVTVEARSRCPDLGAADLDAALRRAGYVPLGPWRRSCRP